MKHLRPDAKRSHLKRRGLLATTFSLLPFLMTGIAAAQTTPPDAGQTLRETQRPVQLPAKPATLPTISVPDEKDPAADPSQRLTVSSIRIEGNVHLPLSVLKPLVADREGKEQSLSDLRAGVRKITTYYREHGYIVARAFIPAQEITDGAVVVRILEGTLVGSDVVNHTAVNSKVLQRILDAQHLHGKVIASSTTDRGLLIMADLPSVGKVAGKLKPGEEVGTSNLIVTADAGQRVDGSISVDDYGNRYTGRNRLNGQVEINSPTGNGDRLSAQATLTDENMLYGRAAYDLPIGGNGLRVGGAISSSTYQLGAEFANLDASGTADTYGLYALYPVIRGLNHNVWLTGNLESRALEDKIVSVSTVTKKSADVLTLQAYGDVVDAKWGGGYSTWSLSYITGSLDIKKPAAVVTDQAGPRTNGTYAKIVANLSRLQALTPKTSLFVQASAQKASKNLDSSEKFVIGGIYGVRAYPQGEGAGDNGWVANIELRHQPRAGVQLSAFYDIGGVDYNHKAYAPGKTAEQLSSYGVSVAGQRGPVNARITLALHGDKRAVTAPDRNPVIWASVGYRF